MLTIEETILPNGEINYSLSEPYDIGVRFHPEKSKNTVKLNLDSLVEYYDFEQCYAEYSADRSVENAEREDVVKALKALKPLGVVESARLFFDYNEALEALKAAKAERGEEFEDVERCPHYDLDYYIRSAPHEIVHGLFLHFSDDGEGRLRRGSVISLTIDGKKYNLSIFFAPDMNQTSNVYFKIPLELLRELAAAASISLTFEYEGGKEGFKDKEIDDFQKYALAYYDWCYIEHLENPEEKEKLRQELQAQKKRAAKEKARLEREKAEEQARLEREKAEKQARLEREKAEAAAARKAEWDAAGPLTKIEIILKRYLVKLILLILFILWILFNL